MFGPWIRGRALLGSECWATGRQPVVKKAKADHAGIPECSNGSMWGYLPALLTDQTLA